jgi:hypothetical protein
VALTRAATRSPTLSAMSCTERVVMTAAISPMAVSTDDLAQHLVRDYLFHGARYFVANRLVHKLIVRFGHRLCNFSLRFLIYN